MKKMGKLYDILINEADDEHIFIKILPDNYNEEERVCLMLLQIQTTFGQEPNPPVGPVRSLKLSTLRLPKISGRTAD